MLLYFACKVRFLILPLLLSLPSYVSRAFWSSCHGYIHTTLSSLSFYFLKPNNSHLSSSLCSLLLRPTHFWHVPPLRWSSFHWTNSIWGKVAEFLPSSSPFPWIVNPRLGIGENLSGWGWVSLPSHSLWNQLLKICFGWWDIVNDEKWRIWTQWKILERTLRNLWIFSSNLTFEFMRIFLMRSMLGSPKFNLGWILEELGVRACCLGAKDGGNQACLAMGAQGNRHDQDSWPWRPGRHELHPMAESVWGGASWIFVAFLPT